MERPTKARTLASLWERRATPSSSTKKVEVVTIDLAGEEEGVPASLVREEKVQAKRIKRKASVQELQPASKAPKSSVEIDLAGEDAPFTPTPTKKDSVNHSSRVTPLTAETKKEDGSTEGNKHTRSGDSSASPQNTEGCTVDLPDGWDTDASRKHLRSTFQEEWNEAIRGACADNVFSSDDLANLGLEIGNTKKHVVCLVEGSSKTLDELAASVGESTKSSQNAARNMILEVALRKITGLEDEKSKQADLLTDTTAKYLWRWEVRDTKLFPSNMRPIVITARKKRSIVQERLRSLQYALDSLDAFHDGKRNSILKLVKASKRLEKSMPYHDLARSHEEEREKIISDIETRDLEKQRKEREKEAARAKKEEEKEAARIRKENARLEKNRQRQEQKRLKEEEREKAKEEKHKLKTEQEDKRKKILARQQAFFANFKKGETNADEDSASPGSSKKTSPLAKLPEETPFGLLFTPPLSRPPQRVAATEMLDKSLADAMSCPLTAQEALQDHLVRWKRKRRLNKVRSKSGASQYWQRRRRGKEQASWEPIYSIPGKDFLEDRPGWKDFAEGEVAVINQHAGGIFGPELGKDRFPVRKLLQFEENLRPPYFGSWSKGSNVVGPRKYLAKDPSLDYDVESDLEWEEPEDGEDIGESDAENEDDNEVYEDEEGDGFVVPDDYLSDGDNTEDQMDIDALEEACDRDQDIPNWASETLQKAFCNAIERARKLRCTLIVGGNEAFDSEAHGDAGEDLKSTAMISGDPRLLLGYTIERFNGSQIRVGMYDQEKERKDREERMKTIGKKQTVVSEDTLHNLVMFLLLNRKLKVNRATTKFVEDFNSTVAVENSADKLTKASVKRKILEIATFEKGGWVIKKDVLDGLGIAADYQGKIPDQKSGSGEEVTVAAQGQFMSVSGTCDPLWSDVLQATAEDCAESKFTSVTQIFSEENLPVLIAHMPFSIVDALIKGMDNNRLSAEVKASCARCLGNVVLCLQHKPRASQEPASTESGKVANQASSPPSVTLGGLLTNASLMPAILSCLASTSLQLVKQALRLLLSLVKACRSPLVEDISLTFQEKACSRLSLGLLSENLGKKGGNVAAHSAAILSELLGIPECKARITGCGSIWEELVDRLAETIKPGRNPNGVGLPKYVFQILATHAEDSMIHQKLESTSSFIDVAMEIVSRENPSLNLVVPALKFLLVTPRKLASPLWTELEGVLSKLKELNREDVAKLVAEIEDTYAKQMTPMATAS